jgi:glycosyltransferase involved in cell wall biosynthesis
MKNISGNKKICIITTVHSPFDTRIFHKEIQSLRKAGYEVVLIAPHKRNETIAGVRILALAKAKNRLLRIMTLLFVAYRKAKAENADIYHLHDPELLLIGKLLQENGHPVIYDMHENLPKQVLHKGWIKPFLRKPVARLVSIFEKFLLSDLVVIFAEHSYKSDYTWIRQCATVLNMPLKEQLRPRRTSREGSDIPIIGYMGVVSQVRGSETMVLALAILKDKGIKVNFECIGNVDESHKERLLTLCRENDLSEEVTFRGRMSATAGWKLIGDCDIGLAVLHPIPNYLESYPTKLFEYMALGIPVIASDFPLWRQVVEHNECGICVDPLQPMAIAEAICKLLSNPELASEMGRNGRRAVEEKYNWANEEKKLLALYEQLLS